MMPWLTCTIGLLLAASAGESPFLEQVRLNFSRWDADRDGELSLGEIELAVASPIVGGEAAAAAVALRRAGHSKTHPLPPLTLANIAECVARRKASVGEFPNFDSLYDAALKRVRQANRDLFGPNGPNLEGLSQGRLGDCFCLAPLGAMVHRDPQDVRKMFHPNPDGSVTVSLGRHPPIHLQALSDGEIALTASTTHEGLWVVWYEKAVGEDRAETKATAEHPTALSVVSQGGSAGDVLALITGRRIQRFSCSPWRNPKVGAEARTTLLKELRGLLTAAMHDNRLVCGGTGTGIKVPGVLGRHAYAILDYDTAHDEVLLWNPSGRSFQPKGPAGLEHGYRMTHGQFRVPLTQLVQFFGGFSFETGGSRR